MNWNARQIPGPLESDVPDHDPDACTECGEVEGCNCDDSEGDEEDESDEEARDLWRDHVWGRGNH